VLTRRRERIIVFVGLLTLNLGFGWMLSRYRKDYRSRTQWLYAQRTIGPVTEARTLGTSAAAQSFTEIVNRTIFRPERTNEPPAETVKIPELPLLYGTMNLGDGVFAMMAAGDQANALSKPVHPGEEVGGFKLVSIGDSQVVVAWGEKQFTVNVWESARKLPGIVDKPAPTGPSTQSTSGGVSRVTSSGGSPAPAVVAGSTRAKTGFPGFNAPPGASADAPAGTIMGGKRKIVVQTPFGPTVRWDDVEPGKDSAQQNPPKEK